MGCRVNLPVRPFGIAIISLSELPSQIGLHSMDFNRRLAAYSASDPLQPAASQPHYPRLAGAAPPSDSGAIMRDNRAVVSEGYGGNIQPGFFLDAPQIFCSFKRASNWRG